MSTEKIAGLGVRLRVLKGPYISQKYTGGLWDNCVTWSNLSHVAIKPMLVNISAVKLTQN